MRTVALRRIGRAVMLPIPEELLQAMDLRSGSKVGLKIEGNRLIVEPQRRPRYTLGELLDRCDPHARRAKEDRDWDNAQPVGRELL